MLQRSVSSSATGWFWFAQFGFTLPWRNQLIIYLQPDQLRFVQYGKGFFRRSVVLDKVVSLTNCGIAALAQTSQWEQSVNKIKQKLPQLITSDVLIKTQIHIVVANQFVRYLLLPWDQNIASREETSAFVQYHFQLAFADSMDEWHLQVGRTVYGQPTLVTAMPRKLINALKNIQSDISASNTSSEATHIPQQIAPLKSITPALVVAVNVAEYLPASCGLKSNWMIQVDSHNCCLSLVENHCLKLVRQYAKEANIYRQIHGLIARESATQGGDYLTKLPIILIDHQLNMTRNFEALPELDHFLVAEASAT